MDPFPNSVKSAADEMDAIYEHAMREGGQAWDEGELSKHYRRDADDDVNVPVADEKGLRNLLSSRFFANKNRDMGKVRKIDQSLKADHGVQAHDHPNVWTRQSQPPLSELRRRARTGMTKMEAIYGPTGHPFQQHGGGPIDPIFCSLSMTQIHTLLSRWMQTRSLNRYEEADSIRFELRLQGVYFDDRSNFWRADGEKFFPNVVRDRAVKVAPPKYTQTPTTTTPTTTTPTTIRLKQQKRIDQLVGIRSSAIVRGEKLKADFIAFELWRAYGVGVDDDTKTCFFASAIEDGSTKWKPPTLPVDKARISNPSAFPPVLFEYPISNDEDAPYTPCGIGYEDVLGEPVRERIQHLLKERKVKLEEIKFIEADAILRELFKAYAIKVNDSTLEWDIDLHEYEK
jgi:hypothetical protein